MKRISCCILIACVGWLFSLQLLAQAEGQLIEPRNSKGFIYTLTNGTATVQKYVGNKGTLTIPETFEDFPVVAIAARAFLNNEKLSTVTIPASIIEIGDAAFASCPRLKNILVEDANPNYQSLDGVLYDKTLTCLIQCPGARKDVYTIPDGVQRLENYCFMFCQKLAWVSIPEGVVYIGDSAFEGVLLDRIELPVTLMTLGSYTFRGCPNLARIRVSEDCPAIINSGVIGKGKIDVTRWTFNENGTMVVVEGYTVEGPFLVGEKQYVDKTAEFLTDRQGLVYTVLNGSEATVLGYQYKYPFGKGSKKKTSTRKNIGKGLVIPSMVEGYPVTGIADKAFFCSWGLKGVVIPETVVTIGESAFMYCTSLTNIIVPPNVTNISAGAFRQCNNLTNIVLGEKLTFLGPYAFNGCSNLITVYVPNSITNINEGVFSNCRDLLSVDMGADLVSIGNKAFDQCISLTNMTISKKLVEIKETFETCNDLQNFDVSPENPLFSSLDGILFDKARKTLIRYPRSKLEPWIGEKKASNDRNRPLLTKYVIPEGVTNIGHFAFSRSPGLTNVVIPNTVLRIEPYAFYFCTNLLQIVIPDNVPSISQGAFSRCLSLEEVVFGTGIKSIYMSAFSTCKHLQRFYFRGDAPDSSKNFVDDWHRITIYRLESAAGWDDSAEWRTKPKRLWKFAERIPYLNETMEITSVPGEAPPKAAEDDPANPPTETPEETETPPPSE